MMNVTMRRSAKIGIAAATMVAVSAGTLTQVGASPRVTTTAQTTTANAADTPSDIDASAAGLSESDKAFVGKVLKAGSDFMYNEYEGKEVLITGKSDLQYKKEFGFTDADVERLRTIFSEYNRGQVMPGGGDVPQRESNRLLHIPAGSWNSEAVRPLVEASKISPATLAIVWTIYQDVDGAPHKNVGIEKLGESFFADLKTKIGDAEKQGKGISFYPRPNDDGPSAETRIE